MPRWTPILIISLWDSSKKSREGSWAVLVIPPISIIKYVKFESGLPVLTIKHPTARQQADFDQYKRAEVAEEAYKELQLSKVKSRTER